MRSTLRAVPVFDSWPLLRRTCFTEGILDTYLSCLVLPCADTTPSRMPLASEDAYAPSVQRTPF